jgi:vacuolar-type H+-ATPase subunit D/Vma8
LSKLTHNHSLDSSKNGLHKIKTKFEEYNDRLNFLKDKRQEMIHKLKKMSGGKVSLTKDALIRAKKEIFDKFNPL